MLCPPPLLLLPLLAVFRGVTPLSALASAPYKHFDLAKLCGRTRTKQSLYLHNQAHRCESYSIQFNSCFVKKKLSSPRMFDHKLSTQSVKKPKQRLVD